MSTISHIGLFQSRHIGPSPDDQIEMLRALGLKSLDELIDETVPAPIRIDEPLNLPEAETEHAYLTNLEKVAARNRVFKTYIGMGYYNCFTPPVIQRNVFENPSWYTPYTPYQAEISQGRLESLMNFQTMIMELTGMEIANASLLDEATAAAEAMTLLHRMRKRRSKNDPGATRFLVSARCFPQVLELLKTRAEPLGIELEIGDVETMDFTPEVFGALVQYPDDRGALRDWSAFIARAHEVGAQVAVGADLMALILASPPGEMGADIVYGSAQRFGVPLGYGGPHAAFFAARDTFKREVPGRIVGVSVDKHGAPAYRLALQAREQHIRRDKATSNICTAQALLANMAAMYGIYHGPEGLKDIARRIHGQTVKLHAGLRALGYEPSEEAFFDTLHIPAGPTDAIRTAALKAEINLRYFADGAVGVSLDETTTDADLATLLDVFAEAAGGNAPDTLDVPENASAIPESLRRQSDFMTHPVFRTHHSETDMMRYIKRLERKDIGLDTSMIPLGSCTMKLNAAAEMMPVSWPAFSRLHPFIPLDQAQGYRQIIGELEQYIRAMTGLDAVSLQPNSGAQGEYAGLLAIRAYHRDRGEPHRHVALIPSSAHGTNPASAIMAGMKVVVVACDDDGYIVLDDLRRKAELHKDTLATLMVTYPSTFGVFEEQIREICDIVHEFGGQVYMDGANMNAQVGITSLALIGVDVCHLNLHKTFAIPHGGGGPGVGPIAVAGHLAPYLPRHPVVDMGMERGIGAVAAAPWGSASILLISYAYVRMLGGRGATEASRVSILSANYIKQRLEEHYDVHYTGRRNRVAHELIFDVRPYKDAAGVTEADVAKRLMDYGFHAPTVSWPVPGTMMIEPTESEPKAELDRFCDAMIAIRGEIQAIINGEADREDNVLRNAPHTAEEIASDDWSHPYTREQAAYPLPFVRANKFWPAVGRIDNTYGDRNLVCACPPLSAYA